MEKMDNKCSNGQFFTDKLLFAIDGCYGDQPHHELILENREFWRLFFKYVGGRYRWGADVEKIMGLNA
ncbi:hypothetical protein ACFLQR_04645, partial [Verrucomicrobiota bacterium]